MNDPILEKYTIENLKNLNGFESAILILLNIKKSFDEHKDEINPETTGKHFRKVCKEITEKNGYLVPDSGTVERKLEWERGTDISQIQVLNNAKDGKYRRGDLYTFISEALNGNSATLKQILEARYHNKSFDVEITDIVLKYLSSECPKTASPKKPTKLNLSLINSLQLAKNIVLEGVPGTGKTHAIGEIVKHWNGQQLVGDGKGKFAVTLHPATSYEDFVEGLRPGKAGDADKDRYFCDPAETTTENKTAFSIQDGFFLRVCREAARDPNKDHIVLLDEINRCNIPKVMGDLLTTIEASKRATKSEADETETIIQKKWKHNQTVTLPYSKRIFFVPDNVYVVATMNTTDRSVAPMDAALRRRFAFLRLWPMGFSPGDEKAHSDVSDLIWKEAQLEKEPTAQFKKSVEIWHDINTELKKAGPDAMLGHTYLFDLAKALFKYRPDITKVLLHHWNHHILPQLVDVLVSNDLGEAIGTGVRVGEESLDLNKALSDANPHFVFEKGNKGHGLLRTPEIRLTGVGDLPEAKGPAADVEVSL